MPPAPSVRRHKNQTKITQKSFYNYQLQIKFWRQTTTYSLPFSLQHKWFKKSSLAMEQLTPKFILFNGWFLVWRSVGIASITIVMGWQISINASSKLNTKPNFIKWVISGLVFTLMSARLFIHAADVTDWPFPSKPVLTTILQSIQWMLSSVMYWCKVKALWAYYTVRKYKFHNTSTNTKLHPMSNLNYMYHGVWC